MRWFRIIRGEKMNDINRFETSLEEYLPEDFVEGVPIGIHERSQHRREEIELKREFSTQKFLLEELKKKEASLQRKLLKINEEIVNQSVKFITEDSFEQFILLKDKVEKKIELEEEVQFLYEDMALKAQYIEKLSLKLLIKEIEDDIEAVKSVFEDHGNDVTSADLEMLEYHMKYLIRFRIRCLNTLRSQRIH